MSSRNWWFAFSEEICPTNNSRRTRHSEIKPFAQHHVSKPHVRVTKIGMKDIAADCLAKIVTINTNHATSVDCEHQFLTSRCIEFSHITHPCTACRLVLVGTTMEDGAHHGLVLGMEICFSCKSRTPNCGVFWRIALLSCSQWMSRVWCGLVQLLAPRTSWAMPSLSLRSPATMPAGDGHF